MPHLSVDCIWPRTDDSIGGSADTLVGFYWYMLTLLIQAQSLLLLAF
jgi:hypothetical protein